MILWLKALHIFFVICWFAGLFYLPRLFVHHAMSDSTEVHAQLSLMEGKLLRFVSPLAALAVIFGLAVLAMDPGYYLSQTWMQIKLVLVAGLIAYHFYAARLMRELHADPKARSHRYYRVFNELPVLVLLPVVVLVIVKPF